MLFFRIFQHLLPRSEAWKLTIEKTLRKYFLGLAVPMDEARTFVDEVYEDHHPTTTRELAEWEWQFALPAAVDEEDRRLALDAEWKATGGQSPHYIQNLIWAAGFTDVYLHEWWASGPPYVARNPLLHTTQPQIGEYQCDDEVALTQPQCSPRSESDGTPFDQPQCSDFLQNDPGYLVNDDLNHRAPPPVPNDPTKWPYFLYFMAETFGQRAFVDPDRLPELKRLLLKVCPTQHWIVLKVKHTQEEPDFFNFNTGDGFNATVWFPYP